mmetsp:Transcript_4534/g.8248  ORF Transcript_4534/g.8248 Transcript_4534/m.8248 type:complete len:81 (+) Transcript_4534:204-446(+)
MISSIWQMVNTYRKQRRKELSIKLKQYTASSPHTTYHILSSRMYVVACLHMFFVVVVIRHGLNRKELDPICILIAEYIGV